MNSTGMRRVQIAEGGEWKADERKDATGSCSIADVTDAKDSRHVVFITKDHDPWVVFGGDVLFQGSIGRTDFPDGDFDQLFASIRISSSSFPPTPRFIPATASRRPLEKR